MDTAEAKIARLERSIAREGQTVVFERLSTNPTTGASVVQLSLTVPAWTRASAPQDLADSEARDIRIVVSPTLLLAPAFGSPPMAFGLPQRDDRVLIEGIPTNIHTISPLYYGGVVVRINMICRGG